MNGEIYKIGIRYVYRIGISIGKVVNICERKNWNFEKLDKERGGYRNRSKVSLVEIN